MESVKDEKGKAVKKKGREKGERRRDKERRWKFMKKKGR